MTVYRTAAIRSEGVSHPTYPLDDADLALIEINAPSALVQRLIHEVRLLRDENLSLQVVADGLRARLDDDDE